MLWQIYKLECLIYATTETLLPAKSNLTQCNLNNLGSFPEIYLKIMMQIKKKKDEKNQLQKKSCYSGGSAVMAQKQMKRLAVFSYTHTHTSNKMCKVYYIYTDATHTQLGLQRENWWKLYIRSHLTHLSLKSQWQC